MHPLRGGSSSVVSKGNSPTLPGMHLGGPLPIDAALPELTAALGAHNTIVLVAAPGAGKTTRVPLVLAAQAWARDKKIIVLEPRRIAARAAAARMAATLRENVGATVGYRVRFGSRVSCETRIEVVTEGIFTRRVLDQPVLNDVAAVLFDEFHERSLEGDLGLALARDVQQGLREDLKLLVMSATLDGARVAGALGGAPVIESAGRGFPVETRYLGRDPQLGIEREVTQAVLRAILIGAGLGTGVSARRRRDSPDADVVAGAYQRAGRRHRRAARRAGGPCSGPSNRTGAPWPAQDRAGNIGSRNFAHHRGDTRGDRFWARARAAL